MILYARKTEFNDIVVTRKGNIITLWSPSDIKQSAININMPSLPGLEYARNTLLGLAFFPMPESILIIGLGGGTIPLMFHAVCHRAHIDVVEIDAEMFSIARRFFKFKPGTRVSVIHDDAYSYCTATEKRYDIVIMDAYLGERQPAPLAETAFYRAAKKILSADGVFVNNLMKGHEHQFDEKCGKILSVFRNIWQLSGETRDNVIIFALGKSISKFEVMKNAAVIGASLPFSYNITRLAGQIIPVTA